MERQWRRGGCAAQWRESARGGERTGLRPEPCKATLCGFSRRIVVKHSPATGLP